MNYSLDQLLLLVYYIKNGFPAGICSRTACALADAAFFGFRRLTEFLRNGLLRREGTNLAEAYS